MGTAAYRLAYTAVVVVLCAACFAVFSLHGTASFEGMAYNDTFKHYINADQYAYLADALLHGRMWLDLPVPDALAQMENPYDFNARKEIAQDGQVPLFWDYAFYDGKYYCYFGVVPALLLYLPYQAITGAWLNTAAAVCVLGLLFVVCACLLVFRVAVWFFRGRAPLYALALAACMFVGGSNVAYLEFVPRFYSVPILASMAFTCLGLWFWLGAKMMGRALYDKSQLREAYPLSAWRLCAGSICMALNIGCRPQFMLACLLAFPLFWQELVHDRTLFSRQSIKASCAAVIPFVVIGLAQGLYNTLRFGSPFDFGSSYNLTGFDMTHYEQTPMATLVVLYWFLLQPVHLEPAFPFVMRTSIVWPFSFQGMNLIEVCVLLVPVVALLGYICFMWVRAVRREWRRARRPRYATIAGIAAVLTFGAIGVSFAVSVVSADAPLFQAAVEVIGHATVEPMFGGYFWLCPMALFVFALPQARPILKAHGAYALCVSLCVGGAFVLLFDAHSIGANQRYFSDFAWYVMLAAVLVFFSFVRWARKRTGALALATVATVLSLVLGTCTFFSTNRYEALIDTNPALYEIVSSVFPQSVEDVGEDEATITIGSVLKPEKYGSG